jgi:cytoskeletal protein CcmA (bactofilin family)
MCVMLHIRSMFAALILAFLALSLYPNPVRAVEFISADNVTVEQGDTTDGTLFAAGKSVTIEGTVDGDLFCATQNLTISGTVRGDVICAGQLLTVTGTVGGNVRSAGQNIKISGRVARNVTIAGQILDLTQAEITGEVHAGGESVTQSGRIGRTLTVAADTATINGAVGGDALMYTQSLIVDDQASVSGDLSYVSDTEAVVAPDATISGDVVRRAPPEDAAGTGREPHDRTFSYGRLSGMRSLASLVFWTLAGLLLISLFPGFFGRMNRVFSHEPLRAFGLGAAAFLIVPVALLLLTLTVIGIPLAMFLGFVWILLLVFSRVFIGVFIGAWILETLRVRWGKLTALSAIVGVPVLWILFKVPFIGWLLSLLAMVISIGALLVVREPRSRKLHKP